MELQDEDEDYSARQLDKDVVNPNQIRTLSGPSKIICRTFSTNVMIRPGILKVPKNLNLCQTDSHAEILSRLLREEFAEENRFCKKITYTSDKDRKDADTRSLKREKTPKSTLAQFGTLITRVLPLQWI